MVSGSALLRVGLIAGCLAGIALLVAPQVAAQSSVPSCTNFETDAAGYRCTRLTDRFFTPLSGATTVSLIDEQVSSPIALGFQFPFYGTLYDSIQISDNGFIVFAGSPSVTYTLPRDIPNPSDPSGLIAGQWEDLDPGVGGTVSYKQETNRFTVQFLNVPHWGSGGHDPTSFQIELWRTNGTIRIMHALTSTTDFDADVESSGIENPGGTIGIRHFYTTSWQGDANGNGRVDAFARFTDVVAPAVSWTFACPVTGSNGWCRSAYDFTASATDGASGVGTQTCTQSGAPVSCNGPSTGQGSLVFSSTATDRAGNSAVVGGGTYKVDTVAPTSTFTATCSLPGNPGWCRSSSFTYNIAATDATSGIASNLCSINSGPSSAGACSGTVSTSGARLYHASVLDNAGWSASSDTTYGLDATAPTATITTTCATPGNPGWCRTSTYSYSISSADSGGSGVVSTTCSLDAVAAPCSGTVSGQGSHTLSVTVADGAGNSFTTSKTLAIDSIAPVVTVSTTCATPGSTGWCRSSSYTYSMTASEATSGLTSTTCALDAATVACSGTVATQGAHALAITATDGAGNSASATKSLAIDSIAPVLTITTNCPTPGDVPEWCRSTYTHSVTASDPGGSGAGTPTCNVPCSSTVASQGPFTLTASAWDVAGNLGSASKSLGVDSVQPTISVTLTCSQPGSAGWCRSSSYTYSASFSDWSPGSGVNTGTAACTLDGTSAPCGGTVSGQGAHTLTFAVRDVAGNTQTSTRSLAIDSVPPAIAGSRTPAANANGWSNTDVTVRFTCSDGTSGPGPAPADQVVTAEGAGQVRSGTCTDIAGNSAAASVTGISIDRTPPVLTIPTTCATPGNAGWCRSSSFDYTVTATDALSGANLFEAQCQRDGSSASCAGTVTGQGAHTVVVSAPDNAGNVGTVSRSLSIDSIPPVVGVDAFCGTPGNAGWCRSAVTPTASASDSGSGIASFTCMLDGPIVACVPGVQPDGEHTFIATAADVAGNTATSTAMWKSDTLAPTVSVDGQCAEPLQGAWCLAVTALTIDVTEGGSGLSSLTCTLSPCTSHDNLVDGDFLYTVTAKDVAGNTGSDSTQIRQDRNGPQLDFLSTCSRPGNDGWCRGTARGHVVITSVSGLAELECKVDDVPAACNTWHTTQGDGWHGFYGRGKDTFGRAVGSNFSLRVDTTPPVVHLYSPRVSAGVYRTHWQANDNDWVGSGVASLTLIENNVVITGPPFLPSSKSFPCAALATAAKEGSCLRDTPPGLYCYTTTVTDNAGNSATSTLPALLDVSEAPYSLLEGCTLRLVPEPFARLQADPGAGGSDASNDERAPTTLTVGNGTGWKRGSGAIWDTVDAYGVTVLGPGTTLRAILDAGDGHDVQLVLVSPTGSRYYSDRGAIGGAEALDIPDAEVGRWSVIAQTIDLPGLALDTSDPLGGLAEETDPLTLKTYDIRVECDPACA